MVLNCVKSVPPCSDRLQQVSWMSRHLWETCFPHLATSLVATCDLISLPQRTECAWCVHFISCRRRAQQGDANQPTRKMKSFRRFCQRKRNEKRQMKETRIKSQKKKKHRHVLLLFGSFSVSRHRILSTDWRMCVCQELLTNVSHCIFTTRCKRATTIKTILQSELFISDISAPEWRSSRWGAHLELWVYSHLHL